MVYQIHVAMFMGTLEYCTVCVPITVEFEPRGSDHGGEYIVTGGRAEAWITLRINIDVPQKVDPIYFASLPNFFRARGWKYRYKKNLPR